MNYEKAYKHALDLAKQVHDTTISKQQKENIEIIFPELKESKDERIRGAIIDHLKDYNLTEWAAWLEKQGEQKSYGQRKECVDCQFNYAGECKGSCAMKRSERKPADKVEPLNEFAGLTDFERTLADICIGWIGKEIGWKQYIKDNADVLLQIAVEK